jgi:hypothetical protein
MLESDISSAAALPAYIISSNVLVSIPPSTLILAKLLTGYSMLELK